MTAQDHGCLLAPMPYEQILLLGECFFCNSYYVACVKQAEAMEEEGMTVQMEHNHFKEASRIKTGLSYHAALKAVASFTLMNVDGASKIVNPEQGSVEDGGVLVVDEIPLVYQLICVP